MAHLQQQYLHPQVARFRTAASTVRHSSARGHIGCNAYRLPSIREFIKSECPVKGLDGHFREQARAATTQCSVIAVKPGNLVVPGQRQLFEVTEQQLEQIIADKGQVLICCFEPSTSSSTSGRKLAAPKKGSWSCLATVAGLQRLPGSSRALVRVLVADRVAVQALDSSNPAVIKAQAAVLRDRWAYFVRAAALEHHLADGHSSNTGCDVVAAVGQVQDAAAELLQLLQQLAVTAAAAADAPQPSSLAQLLTEHEAADELRELLAWCQMQGPLDARPAADSSDSSSSSKTGLVPSASNLLEQAWRLSFAPFAADGLSRALRNSTAITSSSSSSGPQGCGRAALEMSDLGLRLEEALEAAQSMRASLAAQLALNS